MRALVIGCGYVGLPLAVELSRRGHEVYGVCRSYERAVAISKAGVNHIVTDLSEPTALEAVEPAFDWIVNTISSSKGGLDDYRAVYLEGTRRILRWLEEWQPSPPGDWPPGACPAGSSIPLRKYVYTSSTSVYAQTDGSWVTEESAAEPQSETSRVLVETERLLSNAARAKDFPAVILRVAGIYGPERGHLFQQYLRGEVRISGNGSRLINMIHRDDVVAAIIAALERGQPGAIYNVADDEPVTQLEYFRWLGDKLSMPMPPFAPEAENATRKRGLTNKRVSNQKLRLELGCELKYPTFRQGYSAEIARLQAAGQLPVGPGQ